MDQHPRHTGHLLDAAGSRLSREDSDNSCASSIADSPIYSKLTGKLISHEDIEFQRSKQIFFNAALHQCNPKAFAIVDTVDDVKAALRYCQEHDCPLCIVSGGHSDYGMCDGAFVVNLSSMKKIHVDHQNQVATVEPGALLGDLDVASVRDRLATPLGTASIVGIGGQALDLGMGFLTPLFGFLVDNIIEYELVTVDGEQIKVNQRSHPELYWAMKGYGANFGIVTKYRIKLHKIPPIMMGGRCYFSWHDAKVAVKHLRNIQRITQQRCCVGNVILHIAKSSFQVFYRLLYVGDLEDGKAMMNMLIQSCPAAPLFKDIQPVAYDVFQKSCDFMYEGGMHFYQSPGHFLEELSDAYIDTIVDSISALNVADNYSTIVYFSVLGGAVKEIPPESTPFLFKNANWWVGAVGSSAEKSGYQKVSTVINGMFTKLQPNAMTADPVKLADNERRLKAVKRAYDPQNILRNNPCNIVPGEVH